MSNLPDRVTACPKCGATPPTVDERDGVWACLACGNGGDLFDYVMQRDNVTFVEAMRTLGRDAGIDVDEPPKN